MVKFAERLFRQEGADCSGEEVTAEACMSNDSLQPPLLATDCMILLGGVTHGCVWREGTQN